VGAFFILHFYDHAFLSILELVQAPTESSEGFPWNSGRRPAQKQQTLSLNKAAFFRLSILSKKLSKIIS